MRRIAIFIIILLAVFTFINAYTVERNNGVEQAQFSVISDGE
ncbi:hypothetical protein [Salinispira pacifica]|uniref:Uncharacterized protein n=1 Tax=Salinispira pacifica TaxID=1307761 RepID=V5WG72_9SPIO|nr:hypothetical protein [Salinispira pacifica]AHC14615.1 hypothetical protein L21SP2_1214 [Salinispira pacifica]